MKSGWASQYPETRNSKNMQNVPPDRIDLLIGMDRTELLIPSQIRRGNEDEPHDYLRLKRSILADKFEFLDRTKSHEPFDDFLVRFDNLAMGARLCLEHKTRDESAEFTHVAGLICGIRNQNFRT